MAKLKITWTNCNTSIDDDYVFCPKCHSTTVNYGKPVDYKTKLTQLVSIFILILIVSFGVYFISNNLINSSFKSTDGLSNQEPSNSSSSCGPGDASCESNVRNHINGINGVELNFISYIQNNDGSPSGKFRVGVLKQDERGINQFSATITTDCNCKVIDAGGIVSH